MLTSVLCNSITWPDSTLPAADLKLHVVSKHPQLPLGPLTILSLLNVLHSVGPKQTNYERLSDPGAAPHTTCTLPLG